MQLENKVAIVTGASSGIGKSIALALAGEGATITANYAHNRDGAEETVANIKSNGGRAIAVQADVGAEEDVEKLVGETVREFGRVDIMVNNAGIEEKMPFLETPLEVWNRVVATNLTGAWLGCQKAAKQMVEQGGPGRIINVSSVHEELSMPTNAPYCVAKGGLRMLTRTIAVELAPHDITVNNIAPGAIQTPINTNLKEDPEQMQELLSEIPMKRIGQPEEVAQMAVYLASDAAAYVTGSTFFIDGGLSLHQSAL